MEQLWKSVWSERPMKFLMRKLMDFSSKKKKKKMVESSTVIFKITLVILSFIQQAFLYSCVCWTVK